MFPEIELTGLQRLAAQLGADQPPFKPSRQHLLNALVSLLDVAELYRKDAANRSTPFVRIPGLMSELDEQLVPFVRDPVGIIIHSAIIALHKIESGIIRVPDWSSPATFESLILNSYQERIFSNIMPIPVTKIRPVKASASGVNDRTIWGY